MDRWWNNMVDALLPQIVPAENAGIMIGGRNNAPGPGGSAFQGGYYGYVRRVLDMALEDSAAPYRQLKCAGSGVLADCRAALVASLQHMQGVTITQVRASQAGYKLRFIALAMLLMVCNTKTFAAAFAIIEHSARGEGMAFAGGGAIADDASAVWFNPAGIVKLGNQLQVSGHYFIPSFKFTDQGSVQQTPLGNLLLLPDSLSRSDAGKNGFVPNLYYVHGLRSSFNRAVAREGRAHLLVRVAVLK